MFHLLPGISPFVITTFLGHSASFSFPDPLSTPALEAASKGSLVVLQNKYRSHCSLAQGIHDWCCTWNLWTMHTGFQIIYVQLNHGLCTLDFKSFMNNWTMDYAHWASNHLCTTEPWTMHTGFESFIYKRTHVLYTMGFKSFMYNQTHGLCTLGFKLFMYNWTVSLLESSE